MIAMSILNRGPMIAGLVGLLGASLAGCGGGGGSSTGGGQIGVPSPTPGPYAGRAACAVNPAHKDGRARWTILIYMNASNNLQPYSVGNVAQLASIGSDSNVNLVLQWKQTDSCPNNDCGTPTFVGTRRYLLHAHPAADVAAIKGGNTASLNPDLIANLGAAVDMGSYRTLQSFVQWGSRAYPADNLAVLIWDHGSGWLNVLKSAHAPGAGKSRLRAVSQDENTGDEIETWELPLALTGAAQTIDMLILDCSLEQMTEVAYEVRNSARIMVGSEESPPAPGYPYDKWLTDLKSGGQSACDVGHSIIQEFVNDTAYLNDAQYSTELTQSMVDLSQMENVASTLNQFGGVLANHVADQAALLRRIRSTDPTQTGAAQHYTTNYADNKDLWDYADRIRTASVPIDMQQAAYNVENALTGPNGAILDAAHGPTGQNGSHGLAIYVPAPTGYISSYGNLGLAHRAPNWPNFLQVQPQ